MPINWLVGNNSLKSIRNDSRDFARNAYDPSTLNPMRQHAESMANRGIDTDRYRRSALESLSQDPNLEMAGGRAATAMGIASGMDENRAGAISQFESNLMEADLGARERGREQLANVQSQQRTMAATREAALNQIDANYEAELSARKRTLGVAAVGLGISAAGGMPAIGKAIGGLFGGDEAPQAPGITLPQTVDSDLPYDNTDELNAHLFSSDVVITPEVPILTDNPTDNPNMFTTVGVTAAGRHTEFDGSTLTDVRNSWYGGDAPENAPFDGGTLGDIRSGFSDSANTFGMLQDQQNTQGLPQPFSGFDSNRSMFQDMRQGYNSFTAWVERRAQEAQRLRREQRVNN